MIPFILFLISCLLSILICIYYQPPNVALIIVNPQYDFCKGGSLEIEDAEKIIKEISKYRKYNSKFIKEVIIIQREHPENHISFASRHNEKPFSTIKVEVHATRFPYKKIIYQQKLFPDNCVSYTKGAELHHSLYVKSSDHIVKIGMNKDVDSYSGFGDKFNMFELTDLDWFLKLKNIKKLFVCGFDIENNIQATCIDAKKKGYDVILLEKFCKPIIQKESKEAIERMKNRDIITQLTIDYDL